MGAPADNHRSLDGLLRGPFPSSPDIGETVEKILARRREFGISRLGAVTGLDWIGIPVVQVTRPTSRSVAVNQGKGLTYAHAAISGLMESLEGWASERIPSERIWKAELGRMNTDGIWSHLLASTEVSEHVPLSWIEGWDMISGTFRPVPLALVDTDYIIPSPHPHWLERNTTGLAAGTSMQAAMTHACLEILERNAHSLAMRTPHFFDRFQIDVSTIRTGKAGDIIERLSTKGFATGVWSMPSNHDLPAYWCQIMEGAGSVPLAPLPASGFGCDVSHDGALTKALLEACQSRLGAISAAREDVIGSFYAPVNADELSIWRRGLSLAGRPYPATELGRPNENPLTTALDAMVAAGAKAVIAVVLSSDESIPLHVVRIVAPALETSADG
ncbi:YcaO-like family protein [Rhizobium sp. TH2]|uniref:YcaO-like family protein n=1 Tax=Rhizobium sp. TH2 TaxID=2775403 RepID=UPI0021576DAD|nr:YcaO-like family protein [Rhizobium sp. TH2]UVC10527.1 YcaO-like family protein [Rhizobium sp. TH2]